MASTTSTHPFRASTSAPGISTSISSSAAAPLPFAPTLGSRQPASSRVSAPSSRLTTPLAAPPPPLVLAANPSSTNEERKVRYAGAEHTLGPTFSEEEDGDDSEWIAGRMAAVLNMSESAAPFRASHTSNNMHAQAQAQARQQAQARAQAQNEARMIQQLQQQQLALVQIQAQQQQILQLIAIAQQTGQPTQQYREAYAILQMQAQQLAVSSAQLQSQTQLVMQAQAQRALLAQQMLSPSKRQPPAQSQPGSDHRSALAAQVQANLLARNSRVRQPGKPDEADIRARFESVPNSYITPQTAYAPTFETSPSPFGDITWRSSTPKASPFDQPMRSAPPLNTRFDTPTADRLPAFLARRRATDETSLSSESELTSASETPGLTRADTAQTSPNPSIGDGEKKSTQAALGHGRPERLQSSARAYTVPMQHAQRAAEATPRSASHIGAAPAVKTILAVRQPFGPPGDPAELKEKNFQTMMRKQAGLKLNMLGRRTEGSATPTL